MRVAVLVYGRLNRCVEHQKNILDAIGREHTVDWFMSSDAAPASLLADFIRVYAPVAYTNEPIAYTCDMTKYAGKRPETNLDSMVRHFINKARVWSLFENHVTHSRATYDFVLSLRVDVVFRSRFPFGSVKLMPNTVYIPLGYDYVENGVNDQLAFGDMDSMRKYNSVFETALNLLEAKKSIPHPETLTCATLRYHGVKILRFPLVYALHK